MIGRAGRALQAAAVLGLALCGAGLEALQRAAEWVQDRYGGS